MKNYSLLCLLLLFSIQSMAQKITPLNVTSYTNFDESHVEPSYDYGFIHPVNADILNESPNSYVPSYQNRYFMSIYGPRHKQVDTSNIGYFDFHKGADITAVGTYAGVSYDETNPPTIYSMCGGVVDEIFDGSDAEMEATGTGRSVIVRCDTVYNADPSWGNIYIAYRHLENVDANVQVGQNINQGAPIGLMGASGHTSTVHLHLSAIRKNTGSSINVNTRRLFNPTSHTHLHDYLTNAEIYQLRYDSTSAWFRIAIPYNQCNIMFVKVSLPEGNYERIYHFEDISQLPEEDRDDNNSVDGLELFVYPFNRGHSAYRRVWDRYYDGQIPATYPASLDAPPGDFFPFLSVGLLETPAYTFDLKVLDLPVEYDINDLKIQILDIYGFGVQANGTSNVSGNFAWGMILSEEDDAEERNAGSVNTSSSDLELMYDSGISNLQRAVGLRFTNFSLPMDAIIDSASIQFRADESDSDFVNLSIKAELSSASNVFTETTNNITNRPTTVASENWSPPAWEANEMGINQKWDGLENIVQEVVDQPDWTSTSPISFIISGSDTARRVAEGFDHNDLWKNAYIYIEYGGCDSTQSGTPCDDGDECTTNDITDENCRCIGIFQDGDGDTVCDANDICSGFDDTLDSDGDGIPDGCDTCDNNLENTPCDDGDECTINDVYDVNCVCLGTFQDSDGDGICDANDPEACTEETSEFSNNPLTHSGPGSSSTTVTFFPDHRDVSFTISSINQKIKGPSSKQYIEQVSVSYVDGFGITQAYGTFSGADVSSVTFTIDQSIKSVTVNLSDSLDGDSGTSEMRVNLGTVSSCF